MYQICFLQDCPQRSQELADYVCRNWPAVKDVVLPEIPKSLHPQDSLPLTVLLLRDGEMKGFYQLLEQECIQRKDLSPWISPLFVDESERGHALGEQLLWHARQTAGSLGYDQVYLTTNHIQYYEKYGFREIGLDLFESGRPTKIYVHRTIK